MPANFLILENSVRKSLNKLPTHIYKRVVIAFNTLKQNPLSGKKLHGELKNYYKFRIGDYRIVYRFDNKTKTIVVVKVEHRGGVYR